MTHKIDYTKTLEVQIRDGVARQDTPVWWHEEYEPSYCQNSELCWYNLERYPLYYSLEKPEYKVNEDGKADYGYENPYGD